MQEKVIVKRSTSAHGRNLAGTCSDRKCNSRWERQEEGPSDLTWKVYAEFAGQGGLQCYIWCEVIFYTGSLSFIVLLPQPSLSPIPLFTAVLYIQFFLSFFPFQLQRYWKRYFSLGIPTLPTTLYVYLILLQLKDLKHLILHVVSSVTCFGSSSFPPFAY